MFSDYTILCSKLKYYGFQGASHDLLASYMITSQIDSKEFCLMVIYLIGALLQLACLEDVLMTCL